MLKRMKTTVGNKIRKAQLKHIESLRTFATAEGYYIWCSPNGSVAVIDPTTGAIVKI